MKEEIKNNIIARNDMFTNSKKLQSIISEIQQSTTDKTTHVDDIKKAIGMKKDI